MQILLIEDEKGIVNFIKKGLKEESYAIDVAQDGEHGLDLALTNEYDSIILDLMLPKKDGISVCKEIRDNKIKTPILMLTVKNSIKDKVEGLNSGADDYLTKPFEFAELLARIRALIRRGKEVFTSKLQVADLTLNLLTHRVERAGRDIELTSKEYALLEYLMHNKNQVLTRTMIEEHVWDIHFDSLTNVVDVYVNYLRKKVDSLPFKKKLLHTIRGFGYILKEEKEILS